MNVRRLRAIAAGLAMVTSISTLYGAETALAAPGAPQPGQDARKGPVSAADIASARVAARLYGERVEALSERTETSTTWVNKDGSLTSEVFAGPVRFRDAATGQWLDVDVALAAQADGSVASKAHPRGLKLAGKSGSKAASMRAAQSAPATDLVTLGTGDEAITLQWRGGLPAPKLDGTRATYEGAVPGADVIVEATRTGFEQFVEVKAKPEAGFGYTLPLKTKGLKVEQQPDGSVLFTDKKSKKTATMPAPVMWDATVDAASGEHTRRAKVGLKVVKTKDGVDLVITPDAAFLADPATKYPVTVDPSTSSLGNLFDTYVQQGETVDWSNDTELDLGNPGTKNGDGTWRTARSFITWNTAPVADALISDAKLSLWNFHSGNTDCTAQPWEVWTANGPTTASRWTNQPAMVTKMATSTETKGNPGCGSQPDGWVNADVTGLVQHWSNNKWTFSSMGLRATDENNIKQWKRVNSANAASNVPKLTVTYNYRPRTGTNQEAGPPFFSYGGAYTVNTVTPVLRDTFVDTNGDTVQGAYQIFDAVTDTQVGDVLRSSFVPSGQPAPVTVPAGVLTNGKTYKFRSSPYDGTHYNLGWSAWKTFTVDTTAPATTAVASTAFPRDTWSGTPDAEGKLSGGFTFTPPGADVRDIQYALDGAAWATVSTTTAVTQNLSFSAGEHTLRVRTRDKAGNLSAETAYPFAAGTGAALLTPTAGERAARRTVLSAQGMNTYTGVTYQYRRGETDTWQNVPVADVRKASDGSAVASWPLAAPQGKPEALTWNLTDTLAVDGPVEVRAVFAVGAQTANSPANVLTVDRNAGTSPTQTMGPGVLNMLTGDYVLSATDASAFGMTVSRTAASRGRQTASSQTAPIFGKEWISGTVLDEASAWQQVRKTSDTSLALVSAAGLEVGFTAVAGGGWKPEPGSEELELTGSFTGSFTLKDSAGTVTELTKQDPTQPVWVATTTEREGLSGSENKVVAEMVTVDGKKLPRPKLLVAATSAVPMATCQATPSTKGCRVVEFVYAANTTATTLAYGDFAGQVKEIRLWATEPGASAAISKPMSAYRYDDQGRLRQRWNPNLAQSTQTEYGYDAAGRVTTLGSQSELPYTFTYGQAGNSAAAGDGMLLSMSRPGLKQGTTDVVEGTAASNIVYDVPLTGSKAPYQMGAADLKTWGQQELVTDATAVFNADSVPASHDGSQLTAGSYARAAIMYTNASGRETNTASPGGHITTKEYDRQGNTVRSLSAANRELALGVSAADSAQLADLGIQGLKTEERAELLSARTVYDENGTRGLEAFAPLRRVTLTKPLTSGGSTLAAAGESVVARNWTKNTYDEGRPTDGSATVEDQITRVATGAQLLGFPTVMAEARITEHTYDWVKGLKTKTVQDPGGLAITETLEYDDQGRAISETRPGTTGQTATSQVTTYWSATGTGACQGRPEWADKPCVTKPGGQITGGGANPTERPTVSAEYDFWGNTTKSTETVSGQTRTTDKTFDAGSRQTGVKVTGGLGTVVPETQTEYDPVTGRAVKTVSPTAGTITTAFDKLGRVVSYTDADGGTTTSTYDLLDRPVKHSDSVPSTVTYGYDHAAEPRAVATQITDSVAGTFKVTYDADGAAVTELLPGGYTLTQRRDPTGAVFAREYTRTSDGTAVLSDTVTRSIHGQALTHSGLSAQEFDYDGLGRLTTTRDQVAQSCTTRTYTFDTRSNRTAETTAAGATGAACPTSGGTTVNHTYDSADRITDSGYAYDTFGRTTALPGTTVGYYNNDLVRQQTTGSRRQTWQLDASLRFRSWTVESNATGTWTQTASKLNHYAADGDSPAWIVEDTQAGGITRIVSSAAGDFAATTSATGSTVLQLTNIHGDVAIQLPLDTTQPPVAQETDEYGNPRAGAPEARYDYLGGKQRSGETVSGLTLMGVRLYNPATGRFLSADADPEGGANAYVYCSGDAVNCSDPTGLLNYSFQFYLGQGKATPQGVFSYWMNYFGKIFPIAGRANRVSYYWQFMPLRDSIFGVGSINFNVRVGYIGSTYLLLWAAPGSIVYGRNSYIEFWISRKPYWRQYGYLYLNVHGHTEGGTWADRWIPGWMYKNGACNTWGRLAQNLRRILW
ncbi:sugar-binding protein [Streptomyces sp. NBC_00555]|uniref:RHS repeat-associated core domain-containing protein n=1 Tax=Streptomyces sp. NBC_00555 TaxID=2903662 RepID=UPI002258C8FB|nr:RHS repeat-associated core domain-containing protein [Streptomyces sp. NBC_00555]MCX5014173.1 sugar-binding protein [Streptomyces sp. NBC_00555]